MGAGRCTQKRTLDALGSPAPTEDSDSMKDFELLYHSRLLVCTCPAHTYCMAFALGGGRHSKCPLFSPADIPGMLSSRPVAADHVTLDKEIRQQMGAPCLLGGAGIREKLARALTAETETTHASDRGWGRAR